MGKTLVAYFSASGVTAGLAKTVAEASGGDMFEIVPETPYTAADLDWTDSSSRSTKEMNDLAFRPAVASTVDGMDQYDTVLIGFPIWWYQAPTIIHTFLEAYDFSGKKIACFATSGSSGMGRTDAILAEVCPAATWLTGKRFDPRASVSEVQSWLKGIGL